MSFYDEGMLLPVSLVAVTSCYSGYTASSKGTVYAMYTNV